MVVVDSQVHVWAADSPQRPWVSGGAQYAHRPDPLGTEELLGQMSRVGVDRALLVSPTWEGNRNDLTLDAATRYPDRFRVMIRIDLAGPGLRDVMAHWHADPRVCGLRAVFVGDAERRLEDGTAARFWSLAEELDVPVMVFAPSRPDAIEQVAREHPGLRLAIDHLGIATSVRDHGIAEHVDTLLRFARYPNVAVKATGVPNLVSEDYPFPSLHQHIRRVVEAFGAQRVFWGSDVSRLRCDYADVYALLRHGLGFLSEHERALIAGDAVDDWLGWPAPVRRSRVEPSR